MSSRINRPYNSYNNKSRRNNRERNNYNNKKKKKPLKDNFENTMRIRIDDDRINDLDSLDTSFLEGRLDKKVRKSKKAKEKILKEEKRVIVNWRLIRNIFFLFISFCLIFIASFLVINNKEKFIKAKKSNKDAEEVIKVDIDNNYLFIGDRYTNDLNFDDFDYHFVKTSEANLKLKDVLDDMKDKIYRYNPTIVFIELGFSDLQDERKHDEVIADLEKVVAGIKKNRPYAKIYLESLYPVNKDIKDYNEDDLREDYDNDEIKDFNKLISKLVKRKKINYLDMFSLLEKDGKLDKNYTDDGVKLNDEGNAKVLRKIEEIVG